MTRMTLLAGALCLLFPVGCDSSGTVNPGEAVFVRAPEGLLAIGFAFDARVIDAELCAESSCVTIGDLGPYETIEDVVLVRLTAGVYCLETLTLEDHAHGGYGRPAGPIEVVYTIDDRDSMCARVRGGELSYFGHVGLQMLGNGAASGALASTGGVSGRAQHPDIDALIEATYPRVTDGEGQPLRVNPDGLQSNQARSQLEPSQSGSAAHHTAGREGGMVPK